MPGNPEGDVQQAAVDLFKHIKELSQLTFEHEEKREQSLIQQSSQMQTVFSFMSVAIFMLFPILIEYRGPLPIRFFLWAGLCISLPLLVSLVTASIAQWRWKTNTFPDIGVLYNHIEDHYESSATEPQRLKQAIELLKDVQESKSKTNNIRVNLLMSSMISFYISLGFIVFWFCAGLTQLI